MIAQLIALGVFDGVGPVPPPPILVGTTVADLIDRALTEIGIARYVFDLDADEQAVAIRALDRMLRQWASEGVPLGYAASEIPAASDFTGTPAWADEAIALNLALKLAPSYGKSVNAITRKEARVAYAFARAQALRVPRQREGHLTFRGAGRQWWR